MIQLERSIERHLELRPEELMVRHNGKILDLSRCDRVFLYRGWLKGELTNVPPKEYIELQFDKTSATFCLDHTEPAVRVELF